MARIVATLQLIAWQEREGEENYMYYDLFVVYIAANAFGFQSSKGMEMLELLGTRMYVHVNLHYFKATVYKYFMCKSKWPFAQEL